MEIKFPKSLPKFYETLITSYGNCNIFTPKYHESHELVWKIYLKHNSTITGTEWINFSVSEQKSSRKSSAK